MEKQEPIVSALFEKVKVQAKEIDRLNAEVKKLQKCVRGVNVLGRALKETKQENERLLQSSTSGELPGDLENATGSPSVTSTTLENIANASENPSSIQDMDDIDDFSDENDSSDSSNDVADISEQQNIIIDSKDEEQGKANFESQREEQKTKQGDSTLMASKETETNLVEVLINCNTITDYLTESPRDGDAQTDEDISSVLSGIYNDNMSEPQLSDGSIRTPNKPADNTANTARSDPKSNGIEAEKGHDDRQGSDNQNKVSETEHVDWKGRSETLTKDNAALKLEVEKVVKVNNDWEIFWKTKNASLGKELSKKDANIAELQKFKTEHEACEITSCKGENDGASDKNSDQTDPEKMSLLGQQHVKNLEVLVERQRSELTQERQKCERAQKFARSLLQQNKELTQEVKRLNGTLETELQKSLHLSFSPRGPGSLCGNNNHSDALLSNEETPQRKPLSKPPPIDMKKLEQTQMLRSGLEYQENQQQKGDVQLQQTSENHHQQQQHVANDDDTLSVEELKERIMLLKEQKNAYESDFKKERRDREDVVGELDYLKEKLEKTKQKVKQRTSHGSHRMPFANPTRHAHIKVNPGEKVAKRGTYIYPPHERHQLVADGVQHDYYWYGPNDQYNNAGGDDELPCLCPRYHHHGP